ncbi:MAG: DNA alkylation repair protein [Nanoarchaeota archaeon]
MLDELLKEINSKADKKRAENLQRFFKTGLGEYGEGDVFLGIKVPLQREIAKKYIGLSLTKIQELLKSKIHEHRLIALLILVEKFKKGSETEKGDIFNLYLKNTKYINNWDLVDLSSHKIVGEFLVDKKRDILYKLASSNDLWEKRISMISTFAYIKNEDFNDALRISEILLEDKRDLINKAVGWVLREIGKKNQKILEDFLKKHYKDISRTTLRYAIERFPEKLKKKYFGGEI